MQRHPAGGRRIPHHPHVAHRVLRAQLHLIGGPAVQPAAQQLLRPRQQCHIAVPRAAHGPEARPQDHRIVPLHIGALCRALYLQIRPVVLLCAVRGAPRRHRRRDGRRIVRRHRHRLACRRRRPSPAVRHRDRGPQRPADADDRRRPGRASQLLPRKAELHRPHGRAALCRRRRRIPYPADALHTQPPALRCRTVVYHLRGQRRRRPHGLRHIGRERRAQAPHRRTAAVHLHRHRPGAVRRLRQLPGQRLRHRPLIHHAPRAAAHRPQRGAAQRSGGRPQHIAERKAVPIPGPRQRQRPRLSDHRVPRRQRKISNVLHALHRQRIAVAVVSGRPGAAVQPYPQRRGAHCSCRCYPAAVVLDRAAPPAGRCRLQRMPAAHTSAVHRHRQVDRISKIRCPCQRRHGHIDPVLHRAAAASAVIAEADADLRHAAPLDAVQRRIAHTLTLRSTGRPVRPPPPPCSTALHRYRPAP